eukprot:750650_1
MYSNLMVRYLPQNMNEKELYLIFKPYGVLKRLKIVYDKNTGISRGYGFVEYYDEWNADKAIIEVNGYQIGDKTLHVSVLSVAQKKTIDNDENTNIYIQHIPTEFEDTDQNGNSTAPINTTPFELPSNTMTANICFECGKPGHKDTNCPKVVSTKYLIKRIKMNKRQYNTHHNNNVVNDPHGSSLLDKPTNLYVKNVPLSWTNDKLRKVFGTYGQIRQSKVDGTGIAFVRFKDHSQALNA